jgi:hypothetical protein
LKQLKINALTAMILQLHCSFTMAATITVNSTADLFPADAAACSSGNNGTCTLRGAIARAAYGDTVDFATDMIVSIVSGHTLPISESIAINGAGHIVKVDGQNSITPFTIGPDAQASMYHLTIQNGNGGNVGGGAVYNGGSLLLQDSTLSDGDAAYGGGVFNNGSLTIVRCTITNNRAGGGGGGIANWYGSSVALLQSTVSGNSGFWGGAINNREGNVIVVNSTLANNNATAGGAIRNWLGYVTMTNSTLDNPTLGVSGTGSGGDIATYFGSVTLANTIVIGSCNSTVTDQGGNLDGTADCGFASTTSRSNASADLGPLQDNGGPTLTMLPGPSSDAVNAGIDGVCTAWPANGLDQRGEQRPQGAHCDSGAVEIVGDPIFTANFE